ncbi:MAG: hypothetical protein QNJ92_18355 [Alphaproteobacteria bacterium]|nr:hypothetical protein [Alphaproteobacteria bacterium]
MPLLLTIVTEKDLRDYARGALPVEARTSAEALLKDDPNARRRLAEMTPNASSRVKGDCNDC